MFIEKDYEKYSSTIKNYMIRNEKFFFKDIPRAHVAIRNVFTRTRKVSGGKELANQIGSSTNPVDDPK